MRQKKPSQRVHSKETRQDKTRKRTYPALVRHGIDGGVGVLLHGPGVDVTDESVVYSLWVVRDASQARHGKRTAAGSDALMTMRDESFRNPASHNHYSFPPTNHKQAMRLIPVLMLFLTKQLASGSRLLASRSTSTSSSTRGGQRFLQQQQQQLQHR